MVKSIEALARGMQVLDTLRESSPMTLAEIHRRTAISKATLLRILKTLQETGWVYRSLGNSQYRLSYSLQQAVEEPEQVMALVEAASPVIQEIQKDLQWPSDIAVRDGLTMKIVESTRPQATFILNREQIGVRPAMLFSAVGRTYLAYCSEDERKEILEGLKASGGKEGRLACDAVWLSKLLQKTREQGFGEREAKYWGIGSTGGRHVEAMAVPVFNHEKIVATLTVVWPEGSVDSQSKHSRFLHRLRTAAAQISAQLS